MSPNLHPMLNVAIKAARAAGAIISRAALDVEAIRISQKQVNDFVTEVDHASEQAIIEMGGDAATSSEGRATEASVRGFWKAWRTHMEPAA